MKTTDEQQAFRAMVRRFVEERVNPRVDEWEAAEMIPLHEIFAEMAALGMLGLEYEPEYGGQGADHVFTLILAEEFGRCDHGSLPMALGVQVDMATPSLARFGTPELKARYLAPAMRGEMVASIIRAGSGKKTRMSAGRNCGYVRMVLTTLPSEGFRSSMPSRPATTRRLRVTAN